MSKLNGKRKQTSRSSGEEHSPDKRSKRGSKDHKATASRSRDDDSERDGAEVGKKASSSVHSSVGKGSKGQLSRDSKSFVRDSSSSLQDRKFQWDFSGDEHAQIKKIKPVYTFTMEAYSPYGLRTWDSKTKGKSGVMIKFQDFSADDRGVKSYLEKMDAISKEFIENVIGKKQLIEKFDLQDTQEEDITMCYRGGWEAYKVEHSNDDHEPLIATATIFPGQFATLGEYKDGAIIPRKEITLASQVDKLADSVWINEMCINAFDITYNPYFKTFYILPYPNVNRMVWLNQGQNTLIDADGLKKLKEEEELARWNSIAELAASRVSKS